MNKYGEAEAHAAAPMATLLLAEVQAVAEGVSPASDGAVVDDGVAVSVVVEAVIAGQAEELDGEKEGAGVLVGVGVVHAVVDENASAAEKMVLVQNGFGRTDGALRNDAAESGVCCADWSVAAGAEGEWADEVAKAAVYDGGDACRPPKKMRWRARN